LSFSLITVKITVCFGVITCSIVEIHRRCRDNFWILFSTWGRW